MDDGPRLADPPPRFVLANAHVPACLAPDIAAPVDAEGLARLDIVVGGGTVDAVLPAGVRAHDAPVLDLAGRLALPGLVDVHTHLDKGFIWPRAPNPDGSFAGALAATAADRDARWNGEDVRRRMDFALRCAHAHGTVAIRTHLDSIGPQTAISWPVFAEMRAEWAGRIALQAVSLCPVELALNEAGFAPVLDAVRAHGGVLGAFCYPCPRLDAALDALFAAAERHGLDLDFHADETGDTGAQSLLAIARTAIRQRFAGRVLVGHCCSLARHAPDLVDRTLDAVAEAGIAVVSLPMCNLYLQDRAPRRTPRWRGVTLLHELKARGIPVMLASDNVRDPFHAYGDLDLIETWSAATRIAHLDHPFADWPAAIAAAPAGLMDVEAGRVAPGRTADLLLLAARSLNELLARPAAPRTVLRAGRAVATQAPDPAELDDLMETA